MDPSRQAVITGIGVVSPLGIGREAFWQAIGAGASGIRPLQLHDAGTLPLKIGGEVPDFNAAKYVRQRKSIKLMCREVAMGVAAAELAVVDAGLQSGSVDPDRTGVIYGSEMLYGPTEELEEVFRASTVDAARFDLHRFGDSIASHMFPLWMLKYLPNMAACHVGIAQQACGPNNSIVQGEASSLLALIEATTAIERGWADAMITGGSGSRLNTTLNIYLDHRYTLGQFDPPEEACRPFDARRAGQVLSEGAGALLLESRAHAEKRGAKILAEIAAFSRGFEPRSGDGRYSGIALRRVVQQSLERARCAVNELDHVNADGLSTRIDDRLEAQALRDTVGQTPVIAPKSYFGNAGAATGTLELITSLLAMLDERVPPTRNYEQPDSECQINVIHGSPKPVTQHCFLSLNQSTTGQAAAVVFRCP